MIPANVTLFSWIDVEDVLLRYQNQSEWPNWLVWARAYWNGLKLGVLPGKEKEALNWLETEAFYPRFDAERTAIILESLESTNPRLLKVTIEPEEEEPSFPRLVPSLARPSVVWSRTRPSADEIPSPLSQDFPPVVVFHSFKGGVGRTVHAMALAVAIVGPTSEKRVLLIDGDLEAPGITWLLEKRWPIPAISVSDLLALAHADPDENLKETIQIVANRLQGSLLDTIYVLPAFRTDEQFTSLEIRPEHLIRAGNDPFVMTTLLASLGKELKVDAVVVDLRAGLSELSTGLILDPRNYRVLVTTLSGQSVEGTCRLLELLERKSPSTREEHPMPALIITQVPPQDQLGEHSLGDLDRLVETASLFLDDQVDYDLSTRIIEKIESPFNPTLMTLPKEWDDALRLVQRAGLVDLMKPLVAWLGAEPVIAPDDGTKDLAETRRRLEELAERFEYAERAEASEFLAIRPLRRLASDYRNRVPITVVVGAKGSGKTFTFLQLIRNRTWGKFCDDTGAEPQFEAEFCPLLESKNLQESAREMVSDTRIAMSAKYGFSTPLTMIESKDLVRDWLKDQLHEGEWRGRWLDLMAWTVGYKPKEPDAGTSLIKHMANRDDRIIMVVDGLEDMFADVASDEKQRTAIRALLQDVPEWLGQQPGRPLGLIAFVRRDMVAYSIPQNAAQFLALYESYALKWNREEALRLVAWMVTKARIELSLDLGQLHTTNEEQLTEALVKVWGTKLGSDHSREARSAEWVMSVLSDLRLQIQARDVIRFLRLAAGQSVSDTRWNDRILVPVGIRKALRDCSIKKIEEIEAENIPLKDVFAKLKSIAGENKQIPFTVEESHLTAQDIKILEQNGALLRENEDCYMPEIFRLGLNFTLKYGKRPRVLALARRAALRE